MHAVLRSSVKNAGPLFRAAGVAYVTRAKQAQACNTALCLRISDIFT